PQAGPHPDPDGRRPCRRSQRGGCHGRTAQDGRIAARGPVLRRPGRGRSPVGIPGRPHPRRPRPLREPSRACPQGCRVPPRGPGTEESKELLGAYGIDEPVLGRVIDAVYRLLDLITFFTAGDTESRAWEVRRGATAPEAAGVIHSDIQRGFIRAEIIGYDALVAAGSWNNAKSKGVLRLEGKDYRM